ncbi:hypothetical protein HK101_010593 [Irineochytrium annulatum]|nr:hypothetical protein HK101_010593 [Irineochytrium annulatum]
MHRIQHRLEVRTTKALTPGNEFDPILSVEAGETLTVVSTSPGRSTFLVEHNGKFGTRTGLVPAGATEILVDDITQPSRATTVPSQYLSPLQGSGTPPAPAMTFHAAHVPGGSVMFPAMPVVGSAAPAATTAAQGGQQQRGAGGGGGGAYPDMPIFKTELSTPPTSPEMMSDGPLSAVVKTPSPQMDTSADGVRQRGGGAGGCTMASQRSGPAEKVKKPRDPKWDKKYEEKRKASGKRGHGANLIQGQKDRFAPPYPQFLDAMMNMLVELQPDGSTVNCVFGEGAYLAAKSRIDSFDEASKRIWRVWVPDQMWNKFKTLQKLCAPSGTTIVQFAEMLLDLNDLRSSGGDLFQSMLTRVPIKPDGVSVKVEINLRMAESLIPSLSTERSAPTQPPAQVPGAAPAAQGQSPARKPSPQQQPVDDGLDPLLQFIANAENDVSRVMLDANASTALPNFMPFGNLQASPPMALDFNDIAQLLSMPPPSMNGNGLPDNNQVGSVMNMDHVGLSDSQISPFLPLNLQSHGFYDALLPNGLDLLGTPSTVSLSPSPLPSNSPPSAFDITFDPNLEGLDRVFWTPPAGPGLFQRQDGHHHYMYQDHHRFHPYSTHRDKDASGGGGGSLPQGVQSLFRPSSRQGQRTGDDDEAVDSGSPHWATHYGPPEWDEICKEPPPPSVVPNALEVERWAKIREETEKRARDMEAKEGAIDANGRLNRSFTLGAFPALTGRSKTPQPEVNGEKEATQPKKKNGALSFPNIRSIFSLKPASPISPSGTFTSSPTSPTVPHIDGLEGNATPRRSMSGLSLNLRKQAVRAPTPSEDGRRSATPEPQRSSTLGRLSPDRKPSAPQDETRGGTTKKPADANVLKPLPDVPPATPDKTVENGAGEPPVLEKDFDQVQQQQQQPPTQNDAAHQPIHHPLRTSHSLSFLKGLGKSGRSSPTSRPSTPSQPAETRVDENTIKHIVVRLLLPFTPSQVSSFHKGAGEARAIVTAGILNRFVRTGRVGKGDLGTAVRSLMVAFEKEKVGGGAFGGVHPVTLMLVGMLVRAKSIDVVALEADEEEINGQSWPEVRAEGVEARWGS